MSHTPGPWKLFESNIKQWIVSAKDGIYDIAIVRNIGNEDNHANANLIAAAPDLLEACQAIVAWCDKNPPAGDALYCIQQARAAIAKAKGKA